MESDTNCWKCIPSLDFPAEPKWNTEKNLHAEIGWCVFEQCLFAHGNWGYERTNKQVICSRTIALPFVRVGSHHWKWPNGQFRIAPSSRNGKWVESYRMVQNIHNEQFLVLNNLWNATKPTSTLRISPTYNLSCTNHLSVRSFSRFMQIREYKKFPRIRKHIKWNTYTIRSFVKAKNHRLTFRHKKSNELFLLYVSFLFYIYNQTIYTFKQIDFRWWIWWNPKCWWSLVVVAVDVVILFYVGSSSIMAKD